MKDAFFSVAKNLNSAGVGLSGVGLCNLVGSGTETVDFSHNSLVNDDITALVGCLPFTTLKTLELSYNNIDSGGVTTLTGTQWSTLTTLGLGHNNLQTAGVAAILSSSSFPKVTVFQLKSNKMNTNPFPTSLTSLTSPITNAATIVNLDLSSNFNSVITPATSTTPQITSPNDEANAMISRIGSIFAGARTSSSNPLSLVLAGNAISIIPTAFNIPKLTNLELSSNLLNSVATTNIVQNTALESLYLSRNKLGSDCIQSACTTISCPQPVCSGAQSTSKAVVENINKLTKLTTLGLRGCNLTHNAIRTILQSTSLTSLNSLDLKDNSIVSGIPSGGVRTGVQVDATGNPKKDKLGNILYNTTNNLCNLNDWPLFSAPPTSTPCNGPKPKTFAKSSMTQLSTLNLDGVGLLDSDVNDLLKFYSSANIKVLSLNSNSLTEAAFDPTSVDAPVLSRIQNLSLEGPTTVPVDPVTGNIRITLIQDFSKLFTYLNAFKGLTSLDIGLIGLGSTDKSGVLGLTAFLINIPTGLTSITLQHNGINSDGAISIANASGLKNLTSLNLWNNPLLGDKGVHAILTSPNLQQLTAIDLGSDGVTKDGAQVIAQDIVFYDTRVKKLGFVKLSGNIYTDTAKIKYPVFNDDINNYMRNNDSNLDILFRRGMILTGVQ